MNQNKIKVSSEVWKKFKALSAEKAALEKTISALKAEILAEGAEAIASVPEGEKLQLVVVNGNSDEIGKVSVYWMPERVIKACKVTRIS